MNLRKYAAGKPCMIRIESICNGNPETTVLAHLRMAGITGVGLKAPDLFGAWACSACHDAVDKRGKLDDFSHGSLALHHLEGVMRTQYQLMKDGIISSDGALLEQTNERLRTV